MNGHELSDQLVAFLDGALSAEDAFRVERHLEVCPTCRETLEDFRRTGELLKRWTEITPSPAFESRVLAQARASESRRFWNLWNLDLPLRWTLAAAGILLVAGVTYWTLPHFQNPEGLSEADQAEMATDMDLYMNYGVISHLDTLKQMDTLPPTEQDESFIINNA